MSKRILAMSIIILILGLILATIIMSFLNAPSQVIFTLLFLDIIIPILIYAILLIAKILKNRK